MANIQKILSDEIHRLAKKEAKTAMEPLKLQLAKLRAQIADQKEQIKNLQNKTIAEVQVKDASSKETQPDDKQSSDTKNIKLSCDKIKKIRKKLGLSQVAFAKLIGTCHNSIGRWESGFCKPNGEAKEKISELAQLGKRDLQKRLESVSEVQNSEQTKE